MHDITVDISETPIDVTVVTTPVNINIVEDNTEVSITETPIDLIVNETPIVIEFPDPDKVGPKGDKGDRGADAGTVSAPAAYPILAYSLLFINANGQWEYVSADNILTYSKLVGITTQSANSQEVIPVLLSGEVTNQGWNFTAGARLYVGIDGAITELQVGLYSHHIGYAITPNKIFFSPSRAVIRG